MRKKDKKKTSLDIGINEARPEVTTVLVVVPLENIKVKHRRRV